MRVVGFVGDLNHFSDSEKTAGTIHGQIH